MFVHVSVALDKQNRDVSNAAGCNNDERTDFPDIVDCSFHNSESLLANMPTNQLIQNGDGEKILTQNNKMADAKNVRQRAFEDMLNQVKENLHSGNIMRGVIYNEHLDLPIYRKWEI